MLHWQQLRCSTGQTPAPLGKFPSWCYTGKATEARHRLERQHNACASGNRKMATARWQPQDGNRKKQCRPNETKPHSNATHLVVPVLRGCQSPIWTWLVNYLHIYIHIYTRAKYKINPSYSRCIIRIVQKSERVKPPRQSILTAPLTCTRKIWPQLRRILYPTCTCRTAIRISIS